MLSPSNLPVRDISSTATFQNYESLFLMEKEKNKILLARLNEKENLISQLHKANDEAYNEIHNLEGKIRTLQTENDEKFRILMQREAEISDLKKQLNKSLEQGHFRENGGHGVESPTMKDLNFGIKASFDTEHKRLKYMTLGNDRRDIDFLYGNFKENDVEKIKHDLRTYEKFHENLAKAVMDCSPPDLYNLKPPNLKQIWRWIKNLIEEYMTIKTQIKN